MNATPTFDELRAAAVVMFGDAGGRCYDIMANYCERAFGGLITPARPLAIVDAHALGPYNRKAAWYTPDTGQIVLLRRHIAEGTEADTLAHELCHVFQHEHLKATDTNGTRGPHRCPSWYEAVATASPAVLGFEIPRDKWPLLKSVRQGKTVLKVRPEGSFSEPKMTHWPHSFRSM